MSGIRTTRRDFLRDATLGGLLAAGKRCVPRDLDVGGLQDALRADGVDLDPTTTKSSR